MITTCIIKDSFVLFVKFKQKEMVMRRFVLYAMRKSKEGGSLPGVEHKPKKMKETHSETRKPHRDLD